ncbi:MAG: hypothetical protein ACK5MU_03940 [Candidatus Saccharimonadales bacterium]
MSKFKDQLVMAFIAKNSGDFPQYYVTDETKLYRIEDEDYLLAQAVVSGAVDEERFYLIAKKHVCGTAILNMSGAREITSDEAKELSSHA